MQEAERITCHGGGMDERISHGTVSSATDLGTHSPRSPSMPARGKKQGGKVAGQAETSQTLHAKSKYSWEERRRELLPLPLAEHAQLPCSCRAPHLKTS